MSSYDEYDLKVRNRLALGEFEGEAVSIRYSPFRGPTPGLVFKGTLYELKNGEIVESNRPFSSLTPLDGELGERDLRVISEFRRNFSFEENKD